MRAASFWSHGSREGRFGYRWWLHRHGHRGAIFHFEVYALGDARHCGADLRIGGDESDIGGFVGLPWIFTFFWNLALPAFISRFFPKRKVVVTWEQPQREFYIPDVRRMGVAIHGGAIWLNFWEREHEWRSQDPWWVRGVSIHPLDLIFGRTKLASVEIETREVLISMPEGSYPATVKMTDDAWKRPRLPWVSRRIRRAHVEIPQGVPCAGKGENSWDCGDDATYGLTCPARTVEAAVGEVVSTVLRNRSRYGNASWLCGLAPVMAPEPPKEAL